MSTLKSIGIVFIVFLLGVFTGTRFVWWEVDENIRNDLAGKRDQAIAHFESNAFILDGIERDLAFTSEFLASIICSQREMYLLDVSQSDYPEDRFKELMEDLKQTDEILKNYLDAQQLNKCGL
ncbi:hypothetical protein [Planctobacterium marinum]|uniref:Uncharacterized protein n=1 Tax=Planctobacterium marinum TaxID=1631968 RepID=A0AA48HI88_9ALTE|nr:hypothetical protein MACH26_06920 [Planctobacterium marinum]